MERDRKRALAMLGLWAVLVVQALCTLFFTVELLTEVLGLRHWAVTWEIREFLQMAASLGLLMGSAIGFLYLRATNQRMRAMKMQVAAASGAFHQVMQDWFAHWGLTPAEREVALFAVKGFSNREIADIRGKSEATVKVQMNAVFRKAGVSNRAQLVSHFVEDLLHAEPGQAGSPPGR